MMVQVNARVEEADWERLIQALPATSNAERMIQLVRQHLALLDAQRSLPEALGLIERLLAPSLGALREEGVRGGGSEVAEILAKTTAEMAALLLSQAEGLRQSPERALPEIELLLMQRWVRATIQILRTAVLEPSALCHPRGISQEVERLVEQIKRLHGALEPHPATP
jgi:hypothetical protein